MAELSGGLGPGGGLDAVETYFVRHGVPRFDMGLGTATAVNLVPPDYPAEQDDLAADLPAAEIIDGYSERVVSLLREPQFRRLSALAQRLKLEAIVRRAEQESQIKDRYIRIAFYESDTLSEPPEANRRLYVAKGLDLQTVHKRQNIPEVLGGLCAGLLCLEVPLLRDRPIRTGQDLADASAGLCLALEPDSQTVRTAGVQTDELICIPVSGQMFDAIII